MIDLNSLIAADMLRARVVRPIYILSNICNYVKEMYVLYRMRLLIYHLNFVKILFLSNAYTMSKSRLDRFESMGKVFSE